MIRNRSSAKIFVYTAKVDNIENVKQVLKAADGITVTIHDANDVEPLRLLTENLSFGDALGKSLRLNVFKGFKVDALSARVWSVKDNIEWIKNSPLPEGEVLMRFWEGSK